MLHRLTAALQDNKAALKQHMEKSSEEAASLAQQLEAAQAAEQALQEKYHSLEASEVRPHAAMPGSFLHAVHGVCTLVWGFPSPCKRCRCFLSSGYISLYLQV